jgi:hypothetical protein
MQSRPWGRFEQLEARTVLSATMGPADYEIIHERSESLLAAPEFPQIESPAIGFEQSQLTNGFNPSDRQELHAEVWRSEQEQGDHYFVVLATYRPPLFASSREPATPPTAISSLVELPLAAQASRNEFHDLMSAQPAQVGTALASLSHAMWISSPLSTETNISPLTQVAEDKQIDSHDAAFQDYWSEAALSTLKSDRDVDDFDSFSKLASWDEQSDQLASDRELKIDEPKSLLEILNGELTVIDSVLSQLHEFKFDRHEGAFSKQSHHKIAHRSPQEEVVLSPFAENLPAEKRVVDLAEGGMVLLQIDGDLDETQDMTAVFAQEIDRAGVQPLGVEISAGVYQAFEVGNAKTMQSNPVANNKAARDADSREELLSETPKSSS